MAPMSVHFPTCHYAAKPAQNPPKTSEILAPGGVFPREIACGALGPHASREKFQTGIGDFAPRVAAWAPLSPRTPHSFGGPRRLHRPGARPRADTFNQPAPIQHMSHPAVGIASAEARAFRAPHGQQLHWHWVTRWVTRWVAHWVALDHWIQYCSGNVQPFHRIAYLADETDGCYARTL